MSINIDFFSSIFSRVRVLGQFLDQDQKYNNYNIRVKRRPIRDISGTNTIRAGSTLG